MTIPETIASQISNIDYVKIKKKHVKNLDYFLKNLSMSEIPFFEEKKNIFLPCKNYTVMNHIEFTLVLPTLYSQCKRFSIEFDMN